MLDIHGVGSATNAAAVIPSDDTVFESTVHAIYVGSAGDLVVQMGGQEVTFKNAFGLLPISVTMVKTSTTASNIVRLW